MKTNRFMRTARRTVFSTLAACALAAALPQLGVAQTASDTGIWTVVSFTKAKPGGGYATLVMARANAAAPGIGTKENSGGNTFLVISKGKIYLATDEARAASGDNVRSVDYARWSGMKLVQIGDKVRSSEYCGRHCAFGLRDNRPVTLTFFATKGVDTTGKQIASVLVYGKR